MNALILVWLGGRGGIFLLDILDLCYDLKQKYYSTDNGYIKSSSSSESQLEYMFSQLIIS